MTTILIADACKPSLVMSSEVFKDKIAGSIIIVAVTGKQCLEILASETPDMCVVDFDLPDTDGIALIHAMRKTYQGPILLTAYPDAIVDDAVKNDLFAFNDAGAWISKPVKFDVLSEKIDRFLTDKHRLGKRFDTSMETLLVGKGAGRGKRAPKVSGRIVNLSLGGACVELNSPMKFKSGEELTIAVPLPTANQSAKKGGAKAIAFDDDGSDAKIKGVIAWVDKKSTKIGFRFSRLSDSQKRGIEVLLKGSNAA
jgi:CheY-like chemotaxis protein